MNDSSHADEILDWPDAGVKAAFEMLAGATGDIVRMIDVGAHRGETLLAMDRLLDGPACYIGLEPNPPTYAQLSESAKACSDSMSATLLQAAAGPEPGEVEFKATQASAVAGVLEAVDGLNDRVPRGDHKIVESVTVEMTTVDTVLAEAKLDAVDLLKIDSEGFDLQVLLGAADTLSHHTAAAVMCEVFFVPYRNGQAFFWDIAKFMEEKGYHFVNLYDGRNTSQGRLYTANALWLSPSLAAHNDFL